MNKGSWKRDNRRLSPLKTEGGFRLIRAYSPEHNASRIKVHVRKLRQRLVADPKNRRFRLRLKSQKRRAKEKALYLAQQPDTGRGDGNHLAASISTS